MMDEIPVGDPSNQVKREGWGGVYFSPTRPERRKHLESDSFSSSYKLRNKLRYGFWLDVPDHDPATGDLNDGALGSLVQMVKSTTRLDDENYENSRGASGIINSLINEYDQSDRVRLLSHFLEQAYGLDLGTRDNATAEELSEEINALIRDERKILKRVDASVSRDEVQTMPPDKLRLSAINRRVDEMDMMALAPEVMGSRVSAGDILLHDFVDWVDSGGGDVLINPEEDKKDSSGVWQRLMRKTPSLTRTKKTRFFAQPRVQENVTPDASLEVEAPGEVRKHEDLTPEAVATGVDTPIYRGDGGEMGRLAWKSYGHWDEDTKVPEKALESPVENPTEGQEKDDADDRFLVSDISSYYRGDGERVSRWILNGDVVRVRVEPGKSGSFVVMLNGRGKGNSCVIPVEGLPQGMQDQLKEWLEGGDTPEMTRVGWEMMSRLRVGDKTLQVEEVATPEGERRARGEGNKLPVLKYDDSEALKFITNPELLARMQHLLGMWERGWVNELSVEYKNDTIASLKIAGENPNDKASRRDITVPFWMFWRVFGGSNQVSGNNGKETQEYTLVHGGKTLRLTSTDSNERVIQVLRAAEVKGKSLGD